MRDRPLDTERHTDTVLPTAGETDTHRQREKKKRDEADGVEVVGVEVVGVEVAGSKW